MLHLSKPGYLRDLFVRSRWEFRLAVVVIIGELALGVLQGIALGVVLSLLMLIYKSSHPRGAVLGQCRPEAYRDVELRPGAITFLGCSIIRPGGDIFFASASHLHEWFKAALASSHRPGSTCLWT